jgi:hypothetical protein
MEQPQANDHRHQPTPPQVQPPDDLDARIAAAFSETDQPTSDAVLALIEEARSAARRAEDQAEAARETALDPVLPPARIAAARAMMEAALFARDRAGAAISRLLVRLSEIRHLEDHARRRQDYDAAREERDQLARELAEVYPVLAPRLAAVLRAIVRSDRLLRTVNDRRPDGEPILRSAEAVARELGDSAFVEDGRPIARLVEGVRLPAWSKFGNAMYDSE